MAQHKYDMLTVPTASEVPGKHHPWYKERLKLKFINTSKQTAALNGQRWTFVANNTDDFRTGVPCKTRNNHMIKHDRTSALPLISSSSTTSSQHSQHSQKSLRRPEQRIIANNPGRRTLYSKVGPRKQIQQERLEREREAILNHPLQLYPHLEDSIPVELLDGVLGVIDPEMKRGAPSIEEISSSAFESLHSSHIEVENVDKMSDVLSSPMQSTQSPEKQQQEQQEEQEDSQASNLYRFPLKKTQEEHEREKMMVANQQVISASQQSRVDQVTHDLVQWMRDLDHNEDSEDSQHEIDESRIKNLFSSDYESRPAQTAPIHVVELVNVPAELRMDSRDYSRNGYSRSPSPRYDSENQYQYGGTRVRGLTYPSSDQEEPRYVRSKYGAWYLPVDLWRLRNRNEPLRDPEEEAMDHDSEEAMRSLEMDEALAELHGARSFKEFIVSKKKGSMVPTYLNRVDLNNHRQQLLKPK
ncbi:protein FAM47E-like [Halichondria panicea]|uniref:protein FAM47E-like n=1 Tax=Halichondria panicea TaxID=6063 RepID=UPI00312B4461